jgi:acetolactate synthase-1/2/3 large subunit
LHNPDFVEYAKSFGAYGRRVDDLSEFKPIFEKALSLDCPSLIEVPMADRQKELIDGIEWLRSGLLRTR